MNKTELVKEIAGKTGFSQKDVKEVMDALQTVVFDTIKTDEVKIMDGVTIASTYKEAHIGRNPMTGEAIDIEAKYAPKAKFGTAIKSALNA